ncbi:MAG: hypothetical protein FJW34_11250 [Acidobacteria bacterium]|nr:hypothetical protein [Acidobacteriota bacterium]
MTDLRDQLLEEVLVAECQRGSAKALETLIGRWQKRLWRYVYRLTGRSEAAWEVTQESWLGIVQGIGLLQDPARFKAWAYRVTTHKANDWMQTNLHRNMIPAAGSQDRAAEAAGRSGHDTVRHSRNRTQWGGSPGLRAGFPTGLWTGAEAGRNAGLQAWTLAPQAAPESSRAAKHQHAAQVEDDAGNVTAPVLTPAPGAPLSVAPEPRLCAGASGPNRRCVPAGPGEAPAPSTGKPPPRFQTTPSASNGGGTIGHQAVTFFQPPPGLGPTPCLGPAWSRLLLHA